MEVDTPEKKLFSQPCDFVSVKYCTMVGYEVCTKKISELRKIGPKQRKELEKLLLWKDEHKFFREPEGRFTKKNNGLFAFQCYYDHDTKGVTLPRELEDPEILLDLLQSKRCQSFQIEQWLETLEKPEEYPFLREEFLDHPGMSLKLFRKIFERGPNMLIVNRLIDHGILSRVLLEE